MGDAIDVEMQHEREFENLPVLTYNGRPVIMTERLDPDWLNMTRFNKNARVVSEGEEAVGLDSEVVVGLDGEEVVQNGEEADDEEDDSDFRESDEEEDEEDLFIPNPKISKQVEEEIRVWMGKQLGKDSEDFDFDGMEEQVSEYEDSEELISLSESESDGEDQGKKRKKRYSEFNEHTDMLGKVKLELGMTFSSHLVFKDALREYSIQEGKDFIFTHNEESRVSAVCKKKCGWYIWASPTPDGGAFRIKTFKRVHSCGRHMTNSKVTFKWLAKKYIELIRNIPELKLEAFQGIVSRDHSVLASRSQCYRAKKLALKMLEGTQLQQYKMLWDYSHAILKWNPESSVHIQVENHVFKRMYVCFDACKRGLLNGCRKIIGLDACHIKGGFPGQLLCAIGTDANENMFPIAFALCEGETKSSWNWFVDYLLEDIGSVQEHGWTFISDQQKGLVDSLNKIVKDEDSRFCVRHLYENFKKEYKGKTLKDAMWNCARATTEQQFKNAMEAIKQLDEKAYQWLMKRNVEKWSRHAFSTKVKSDMLLNNISECFNSYILQARDKPIITMMEIIRRMLMKRFYLKMEGMRKLSNPICPRIQKKLEGFKQYAMNCICHLGRGSRVEVDHCWGGKHVVDLDARTCTCRKWDLTGISCGHACAAILFHQKQPEDFVDKCYHRDTFLAIYEPTLHPMPGPQEWPKTNYHPITPPQLKKKPGRPKKARRRDPDEVTNPDKISKEGTMIKCGRCNEQGHNARKCKKPVSDPKRAAHLKMKAEKAAARRAAKKAANESGGAASQPVTAQGSVITHSRGVASQPGVGSQPRKKKHAKKHSTVGGRQGNCESTEACN